MVVLVRYSEIGLKGGNRNMFERKLIDNIRSALAKNKVKFGAIANPYGRIAIETDDDCKCLNCVFGIASFSPAVDAGTTLETAKSAIIKENLLSKLTKNKTFRVSCQRLDKSFPLDSHKIEQELGAFVVEKKGNRARMKGFDFELGVEVINGRLFLFTERISGQGGLPVGVEGKVVALIKEEKDLLAALLMMKRGCAAIPVLLKAVNTELLDKYGSREKAISIKKVSEADEIAEKSGANAVVVSQTLENFSDLKLRTAILRPLITYDEDEITEKLEKFRREVC